MSKYPQIYALQDPITESIRYIGKAKNPAERFKSHLREVKTGKRSHYPVYNWIAKLATKNLRPNLIVLASAVSEDWQSLEKIIIAQYREELGKSLLNVALGGDQPYCTPDQYRSNAFKLNEKLRRDPLLLRIRYLKQQITNSMKYVNTMSPERREEFLDKLRDAGAKRPDLFGEYRYL